MITLTRPVDFTDYTILLPSIAVGNVGQLSVDLIISTRRLKRVGVAWHPALMPIFGPPAYQHDPGSKTTSCELYIDEKNKFATVQFRAPLVASHLDDFLQQLGKFFVEKKVGKVLILSSSHAYEKHTVETTPFEFLANEQFRNSYGTDITKQAWLEFKGSVIHGGGNAQKLLNMCTENEIPAFVLFKYVSEGDNSPDARQLIVELNRIYKMFDTESDGNIKLTVPISWNYLFGNESPEMIF